MNEYFDKVATTYPPPLVLNVEPKSNTLRFQETVITGNADRLSCRLWNSVARNTGSGDTVLTRLLMMEGGTDKVEQLSWVVGTIYRIVQGCFGDDDIVLSILELKMELETGLLKTAIARVEQSKVMKGKE